MPSVPFYPLILSSPVFILFFCFFALSLSPLVLPVSGSGVNAVVITHSDGHNYFSVPIAELEHTKTAHLIQHSLSSSLSSSSPSSSSSQFVLDDASTISVSPDNSTLSTDNTTMSTDNSTMSTDYSNYYPDYTSNFTDFIDSSSLDNIFQVLATPVDCSNVTCNISPTSTTPCDDCTNLSPCCGFCYSDADLTQTTGYCTSFVLADDGTYSDPPLSCVSNTSQSFTGTCGMPDITADTFLPDGLPYCTNVSCPTINCGDCLSYQSLCCGWCPTTSQCVNYGGDPSNILPVCNSAPTSPSLLKLTTCEDCSSFQCNSTYTTCDSCSQSYCCGWCASSKTCQNSNPTDSDGSTPLYPSLCLDQRSGLPSDLDSSGLCDAPRGDDANLPPLPSNYGSNNITTVPLNISYGFNTNAYMSSTLMSRTGFDLMATTSSYIQPIDVNGFVIDPIMNIAASMGASGCQYNGVTVGYLPKGQSNCFCTAGYALASDGTCIPDSNFPATFPSWSYKLIPFCSGVGTFATNSKNRNYCDAPEFVSAYSGAIASSSIPNVTLDYAIFVLANDDGSNPALTSDQLTSQNKALNNAFAPAGIQWNGRLQLVTSTAWRTKTSVPDACTTTELGNNVCTAACNTAVLGYDGGDCSAPATSGCLPSMLGNGVCDDVCNTFSNKWDNSAAGVAAGSFGDCCSSTSLASSSQTCKNKLAPQIQRAYYTLDDLVNYINTTNQNQLNVIINEVSGVSTMGVCSLPQNTNPYSSSSGSKFYSLKYWGTIDKYAGITAVHEFGHGLGLGHVFDGPSLSCTDVCQEHIEDIPTGAPSKMDKNMWVGDLHSDTNPMPEYYECNDCTNCAAAQKTGCTQNYAGTNTPFKNYMAYGDDTCLTGFSTQQIGRMRCFADSMFFGQWYRSTVPPPVLLKPVNTSISSSSVVIEWLPALAPLSLQSQFQYTITRYPAFSTNVVVSFGATNSPTYNDTTVTPGTYNYYITTLWNGVSATTCSPPLTVIIPAAPISQSLVHLSSVSQHQHLAAHAVAASVCLSTTAGVCNKSGKCLSNGVCACNPGYYGPDCSHTCPTCGGSARSTGCSQSGACLCKPGYTGTSCQLLQCPLGLQSVPCSGPSHGTCNYATGVCKCNTTWTGSACSTTLQTGCPVFNGTQCGGPQRGVCSSYQGINFCQCFNGTTGVACQNSCPLGANNTVCSGHGLCSLDGLCICAGLWKGSTCATKRAAVYATIPCSSKTTNANDGVLSLDVKTGACAVATALTFGDASFPIILPNGTVPLSPCRSLGPQNKTFAISTANISFPLAERSKTRYANISTAAIYETTDGKSWSKVKNSTYSYATATVTAAVTQLKTYIVLATSQLAPVSNTPSALASVSLADTGVATTASTTTTAVSTTSPTTNAPSTTSATTTTTKASSTTTASSSAATSAPSTSTTSSSTTAAAATTTASTATTAKTTTTAASTATSTSTSTSSAVSTSLIVVFNVPGNVISNTDAFVTSVKQAIATDLNLPISSINIVVSATSTFKHDGVVLLSTGTVTLTITITSSSSPAAVNTLKTNLQSGTGQQLQAALAANSATFSSIQNPTTKPSRAALRYSGMPNAVSIIALALSLLVMAAY